MFDSAYCIKKMDENRKNNKYFDFKAEGMRHEKEISKLGEFRILESYNMQNGIPIEVSLHPVKFAPPSARYPHYHDFFEIVYVYKGEMANIINKTDRVILDNSRLLLMNPETRHVLDCYDKNAIVFNILLQRFFVEKSLLNMIGKDYTIFNFFFNSTYHDTSFKNYLVLPTNSGTELYIQNIINESCKQNPYYEQMMISNLVLLFGEFARAQKLRIDTENESLFKLGTISEILKYIELNYSTATLESVARHFNYSEAYLSRMIKKHTNKTFSETLNEVRFKVARNYLETSDLSVEKTSEIIGYQNVSNFFRNFKKIYGVSPQTYRKMVREQVETN